MYAYRMVENEFFSYFDAAKKRKIIKKKERKEKMTRRNEHTKRDV